MSILLSGFGLIVVVVVAVLFQYLFVLQRWAYIDSVSRDSFTETDWTVYNGSDIKTTYYQPGKLGEILEKWPHGVFHLFRVHPDLKYEFDASVIDSETVARKLDYDCTGLALNDCSRESVLVANCIFDMTYGGAGAGAIEEMVDAASILTGEGKGYHASFANMTNRNTVQALWDTLNLPFSLASTVFEHAFISNLDRDTITAAIHANPMTDSMAFQIVGRKSWLFFPSDTYLTLMRSTFSGSALFPKRSPPRGSSPEVYTYTSEPGDVLFFPESWGHSVYTYEGPNLLMNFRQIYPGNFLRQPLIWLSSLYELTFQKTEYMTKSVDEKVLGQIKHVPQKKETVRVQTAFKDMCDGGRSDFDTQLLGILKGEVNRFKSEDAK